MALPQEYTAVDMMDEENIQAYPAHNETVGETLSRARRAANLDLSEVVLATKIKQTHLEALETSNFDALPAVPFASGFVKVYAIFLDMDPAPLVQQFKDEAAAGKSDAHHSSNSRAFSFLEQFSNGARLAPIFGVVALGLFAFWMVLQVFQKSDEPDIAVRDDRAPRVTVDPNPVEASIPVAFPADPSVESQKEVVIDDVFSASADSRKTVASVAPIPVFDEVSSGEFGVSNIAGTSTDATSDETADVNTDLQVTSADGTNQENVIATPLAPSLAPQRKDAPVLDEIALEETVREEPVREEVATAEISASELQASSLEEATRTDRSDGLEINEQVAASDVTVENTQVEATDVEAVVVADAEVISAEATTVSGEGTVEEPEVISAEETTATEIVTVGEPEFIAQEANDKDVLAPVLSTSPVQEDAPAPAVQQDADPVVIASVLTQDATPVFPPECSAGSSGAESVNAIFDVTPEGRAANIGITKSTNNCFNDAALNAIKGMRFNPRTVDGIPQIEIGYTTVIKFPA